MLVLIWLGGPFLLAALLIYAVGVGRGRAYAVLAVGLASANT